MTPPESLYSDSKITSDVLASTLRTHIQLCQEMVVSVKALYETMELFSLGMKPWDCGTLEEVFGHA